jgi:hypothetical protein
VTGKQPDLSDRIMADLTEHPGTTAGQMAIRLEANKQIVFWLLDQARTRDGTVRRYQEPPRKVWRWAIAENVADPGSGPPVP